MKPIYLSVVMCLVVVGSPASANERRETLSKVARAVKGFLEGREGSEIRLGSLTGDPQPQANAGPGLLLELGRVLVELKLRVTESARYELRGKYELKKDGETRRLVVELSTWIVDRKAENRIVTRLRAVDFSYVEEFAPILGLTVSLDSSASDDQRERTIAESRDDERQAPLEGTRVLARPGGRYAVEILKPAGGGAGEPVRPQSVKGAAEVKLARADVYQIRLSNGTEEEVAVEVFIDGLNVFTFSQMSDVKKAYPRLLIPARGSVTLRGWPISLKESREFKVAEYPKTAAFTQGIGPGTLGVITATFAPAYKQGKRPKEAKSAPGPYGTGFGEPISTPFKQEPREFGPVKDCITVRYIIR